MPNSLPTVGGDSGAWGPKLNTWLRGAHNADGSLAAVNGTSGWVNVKDPQFGAVGDGVTDDTAAIQAAVNYITGSANPATTTRTAIAPLFFPPGIYKVTSDLIIRSVLNFRFLGSGTTQTIIYASGTGFTQAVLFIDGSCDGVYEGFDVRGDGTEAAGASILPDGIRLDWTSAAARSTTGNAFRDIRVRSLKFNTGISLEGNGSVQVDGTCMENIVVSGGQTPGSWVGTGLNRVGIAFGSGTFANNYDHVGMRVDVSGCYYGYAINVSSFALYGAQPAGNFADFYIVPNGQITIQNIQSQNSGQFLINPSGFSPIPVSVSDVNFITAYPQAGNPFITLAGGLWKLSNIIALMTSGASYVAPKINVNGSTSTRPCQLVMENICLNGAKTTCIVPTAGQANISCSNYCNYNPATAVYTTATGDVQSYYTGSSWNNG